MELLTTLFALSGVSAINLFFFAVAIGLPLSMALAFSSVDTCKGEGDMDVDRCKGIISCVLGVAYRLTLLMSIARLFVAASRMDNTLTFF